MFWPWFFRRVRPCRPLRGAHVPGTRWTGEGSVAVRHRPLPVLGAPVSLLWRVPSAGSSLAVFVVFASACVAPRLRSWVSRWFSWPPGVGLGLPSLFLVVLASSAALVELVFVACVNFAEFGLLALLRIFSAAGCPPGGDVCGISFRHMPPVVFILAGSFGVFIALRSSRSGRLPKRGAYTDCAEQWSPGILSSSLSRKVWWKRGNRDSVVCGCMWGPLAVGACRPLGLGCGRRRAPPRDSDAHHPHARNREWVTTCTTAHTHRERATHVRTAYVK